MDFLSPSPYYYYGYDHPIGKDYLSYLLFNIEANTAWSNKPVIPFVWMRVHDSYDPNIRSLRRLWPKPRRSFRFFQGQKDYGFGKILFLSADKQENYAPYEHFINGLYRLSTFKDMFEGTYQLVIPQSARDHMQQQNPIWRGVVKGSNILIAAQNPYAADNVETPVTVSYQNWARVITLKGKEVFLCKFDLNDTVNGNEPALSAVHVYPNPAGQELNVSLTSVHGANDIDFTLTNTKGQNVLQQKIKSFAGETRTSIVLPRLSSGIYFARFTGNNRTIIKKVVVLQLTFAPHSHEPS